MINIVHRLGIRSDLKTVYRALSTINGIARWWTEHAEGNENPGGGMEFRFLTPAGEEIGKMVMEVQELIPEKYIRWRCKDGPREWIGTDITFELSFADDQTILIFGHRNWQQEIEFTAHCSMKWAVFLLSLREYVETGRGRPSPHDIKIDNWN